MRVLVADDEVLVADLISDFLENDERVGKVFSIYNPDEILNAIKENSIDLVFLDLYMPNLVGMDILSEIKEKYPKKNVIILSSHFQAKYINKALGLGANGFLSKSINKSEIKNTLDNILTGKIYLCKECYRELDLNKMHEQNPKISFKELLTAREEEVLEQLVEGKSSTEIGELLFISKDTVETHKKHLYEKFNVKKITQLVKIALENDLV
jgi:DNA-binding NarL/FixJ family response regulator